MIPALLARIGLPVLMQSVTTALESINNPVARTASDTLQHVTDAIRQGTISHEDITEANRHVEAMTAFDSAEFKTVIEQVNASLRAETASQDMYVRRMRPTFGYIMAVTWAAQMLSIAYVILDNPEKAGTIMQAMGALGTIWTVGLSVLGIYVYKRSQEKSYSSAKPLAPEKTDGSKLSNRPVAKNSA